MGKCKMKCWPGYRRVSGKGCGKGSCVKKGTKKRTKRVRRRARRKARGTKRRYKNIRNVTMRESLAIQNRLNRRKSKKKKKSLSRKIKKGVGKIKKMLTLPEKLQRPFDPETGYFGKTQRQIRRSMKMYSKRKYKKRSKRKSKRKSKKSKMSCNRVKKSYRRGKKFMVKACSKGKTKLIHFGATGYGHNYSKGARKSFRARHRCKSAKNKLTARYWSCKHSWTRGGSKRRCPKGRRCKR